MKDHIEKCLSLPGFEFTVIDRTDTTAFLGFHETPKSPGFEDSYTSSTFENVKRIPSNEVMSHFMRYYWCANQAVAYKPYLEIGCGYMDLIEIVYSMRRAIPHYTLLDGTDLPPKRLGKKIVVKAKVDLENPQTVNLLDEDFKYGTIMATEVLEHVSTLGVKMLLDKFTRILDPEGLLVTTIPLVFTDKDGVLQKKMLDAGHLWLGDPDYIRSTMGDFGFIVEKEFIVAPLGIRRVKKLGMDLAKVLWDHTRLKGFPNWWVSAIMPFLQEIPWTPKCEDGYVHFATWRHCS